MILPDTLMSLIATTEYKVLVTHLPVSERNRSQWRALLLGFPDMVTEADSREQAITQLEERLRNLLRHSEIMTLTAPSTTDWAVNDDDALLAQGWDDHGLFRNDPEALMMFDEIEEERNRHTVGGE